MNVLSLFDGMSCGQIALKKLGIKIDNYFACEIDKYAIKVTMDNFPNTKQLGDVTKVDFKSLPKIDLLIGGSPCQGFSFAGKQLNFNDPRSALFFEYVRALKETQPKYFLLENVRMKKEYQDVITEHLGVEPILINSALVSAQNRNRLYWTNISNVRQPEDKKIYLKDIIQQDVLGARLVNRRINEQGKRDDYNKFIKLLPHIEINNNPNKSNTLSTVQKDNVFVDRDKSYCIDANYFKGTNLEQYLTKKRRQIVFEKADKPIRLGALNKSIGNRVYHEAGKSICLSAHSGGLGGKTGLYHDDYCIRKLTPVECERLQTVPDNYTASVSSSQRYKMLGNGWTVDVIAHILKNISEEK